MVLDRFNESVDVPAHLTSPRSCPAGFPLGSTPRFLNSSSISGKFTLRTGHDWRTQVTVAHVRFRSSPRFPNPCAISGNSTVRTAHDWSTQVTVAHANHDCRRRTRYTLHSGPAFRIVAIVRSRKMKNVSLHRGSVTTQSPPNPLSFLLLTTPLAPDPIFLFSRQMSPFSQASNSLPMCFCSATNVTPSINTP